MKNYSNYKGMSALYNNITETPLVDYSNLTYSSSDFYEYFDSTMEAFDSFYKKYNLILLYGTGNYANFPGHLIKFIDFKDMEHAIGISSFGQSDQDAQDFLKNLISCISLRSPNQDLINEFQTVDSKIFDAIIKRWEQSKALSSPQYQVINDLLKKYKNVYDYKIQQKMLQLSRVLLKKAYSSKGKLIKYRQDINQREEEIINDLIYFIDNITNTRIKSLLFKFNDFENMNTYDENNVYEYDEKALVLGYFTSYLSSKYDINENNKNKGINVGRIINEAKEKYCEFYIKQVVLDIMDSKPNTIKKKINEYLKDNNDYFNQTLSKTINQTSLSILTKDNIDTWYDKLCNSDDINDMINVYNVSKNLYELIETNKKEIEENEYKELEMQDECNKLLSQLRKKYSNLSDEEFDTLVSSMIRNKSIDENNTNLEQQVIISYRKMKSIHTKIESLKEYNIKLEKFAVKSTNYEDKVKIRFKELLEDYTNDTLDMEKNGIVIKFICDLMYNNYRDDVTREIKARFQGIKAKTNFLDNLIDRNLSADFEINNKRVMMTTIFDGLTGYSADDSDYDNALKLVSEVADCCALSYAYSMKDKSTISSIIDKFKNNTDGLSIIHLVHALMKDPNVESLLESKFRSKNGISFNYDKILHKCLALSSIDEILTTRATIIKTVDKVKQNGPNYISQSDIETAISEIACPYILLLGGTGDTKTLVYLSEEEDIFFDPNNKTIPDKEGRIFKLVPLHAIKFDTKDELKLLFTKSDFLSGQYLPLRKKVNPTTGIEISASNVTKASKI